ncbi:hypothetical protein [Sphingobium sp. UBA5915]|uniref:hypothetical protein n=1 Tax=Sphingobium sp. UBA5915 TaxID=1947530 RepID=UPI0025D40DC7|nr:hypothetical protein [Sphingobium sp. UBA5915]
MTRHHGHDQFVECGGPASHRMICPTCEVQHGYRDRLVDDVQPDQRPPLPLRIVENPHAE